MNRKRISEYKTLLLERLADLVEAKRKVAASIKHVQAEIRALGDDPDRSAPASVGNVPHEVYFEKPMPLEQLRGMSQPEAAVAVAKHYGGLVRIADLIRILQEAALLKSKKNAANIVYRVVVNSDRFVRISTGLYRLKSSVPLEKGKGLDDAPSVSKSQIQ